MSDYNSGIFLEVLLIFHSVMDKAGNIKMVRYDLCFQGTCSLMKQAEM